MSETNIVKKRVYLSGPISGYDLDSRKEEFRRVAYLLEAKGYKVSNPMDNGVPDDAPTKEHMKADILMLLKCDAIYMMSRWNHSAGCLTEFHIATAIGLDVYFEDCYAVGEDKSIIFK